MTHNEDIMLADEFTYLEQTHPDIITELRYFSKLNFTGDFVPGYFANKAIMTKIAAEALSKVQERVAKDGFNLVIYDTYRPIKAVESFVNWAETTSDDADAKRDFYPYVERSKSFESGYISSRSAHSRGSTVDLSLIEKSSILKTHHEIIPIERELPDGRLFHFLDDGTLDMGSHFDLFDKASWHEDSLFSGEILERRTYLQNIMKENGFDDYRKEWWHYCLLDEPFPETRFDFDIR